MSGLKLGKQPATNDPRDLRFAKYLTGTALKTAPKGYGHQALVDQPWGMLGNDQVGDCVIAGAMHATMVWNAAAGRQVPFTPQNALDTYAAITGYDPSDPSSDQGTNMRDAFRYRRSIGVPDAHGGRHRIGAYLSIDPKDTSLLLKALYFGELVEIGFEFPASAMSQFNRGAAWTVVHGSPIEGGHDVPIVARPTAESLYCVTWGRLQRLTFGFYRAYNDEAWVAISEEMLNGGKSLEGFDVAALNADLAAL